MRTHKGIVGLILVAVILVTLVSGCTPAATPTAAPQPTKAPAAPAATAVPTKPPVDYPTKDITFIVTYNAGGGFDLIARMLAPFLEKYLPKKVNVVVKNVAGAGGTVGSIELYDAKADGYTIGLLDADTLAVAQVTGKMDKRDVRKMTWLGRAAEAPFMALVGTTSSIKKAADIKGQTVRVGVTALEIIPASAVLKALGATTVKTTVFNGAPEATQAVMRGDLDMVFTTFPTLLKNLQSSDGKLAGLFVCSDQRRPETPDVPTVKELGATVDAALLGVDRLIAAPPGVPADVVALLDAAIQKAIKDPDFVAQMNKANYLPKAGTSAESNAAVGVVLDTFDKNKDALAAAGQ
jgi:tripartite-type tricarboxylate transporter receptor subunit TctC